ncbi:MAG: M24 family metallopeptidase [Phycisphaerales bacterium]
MSKGHRVPVVSQAEADLAFAAAQCVVKAHQRIVQFLRVGQTLAQIDAEIARILADQQARSAFLHYRVGKLPPFPSHACLSVNSCVVHGTVGAHLKPMAEGDILKVDIGVVHKSWIGDAGWTYAFKRFPSPEAKRMVLASKESLRRGVRELHPENTYLSFAREVQRCVEHEGGFHLIRGLGGHGIGKYKDDRDRGLHRPPFVSNVVPRVPGDWPEGNMRCEAGTLVAVEPMVAMGTTGETHQPKGQWPVYPRDMALTAHHEHDVLITERGPRVLTEGLDALPDIVG